MYSQHQKGIFRKIYSLTLFNYIDLFVCITKTLLVMYANYPINIKKKGCRYQFSRAKTKHEHLLVVFEVDENLWYTFEKKITWWYIKKKQLEEFNNQWMQKCPKPNMPWILEGVFLLPTVIRYANHLIVK